MKGKQAARRAVMGANKHAHMQHTRACACPHIGGDSPQLNYHDCSGPKSQVTPQGRLGFELATNGIQLYAIANLGKTFLDSIILSFGPREVFTRI